MAHPLDAMENKIIRIRKVLDDGWLSAFSEEERRSLRSETDKVQQRLFAIEGSFLTIGLLGGTGVGKSSLMNALAGSQITSVSHRRPHTDQVLIYRHVKAESYPRLRHLDLPWKEVTHTADAIEHIVLCDLPDYDSITDEHRATVLGFMEHLDVLIWLTSPEKYADARFYELLTDVTKARQNFYFVLNKIDLLFTSEDLQIGFNRLESLKQSFGDHIEKHGIAAPLIFSISASEVLHGTHPNPWNQFIVLRQQIFQQRDVKQMLAIKAANLDVEVQRLISDVEEKLNHLRKFGKILQKAIDALDENQTDWRTMGEEAVALWLGKERETVLAYWLEDPSHLVGPGHALGVLHQLWHGRTGTRISAPPDFSPFAVPEETLAAFRRKMEAIGDRINHSILRKGLSPVLRKQIEQVLRVPERLTALGDAFGRVVATLLTDPPHTASWTFRFRQYVSYLLLGALLLLAIGSKAEWHHLVADANISNTARFLLSFIHFLFSAQGLTALGSYIILNLFLGYRFYRLYRKRLHRRGRQIIEAVRLELIGIWQKEWVSIRGDLAQLRSAIEAQSMQISSLRDENPVPVEVSDRPE